MRVTEVETKRIFFLDGQNHAACGLSAAIPCMQCRLTDRDICLGTVKTVQ